MHFDLHYSFISIPSQSELAQECHSKRARETSELTGPSDEESGCSEKIAQKPQVQDSILSPLHGFSSE